MQKGQEKSGMGRWKYITILGWNNNKRTTILAVHRLCKELTANVGNFTVPKNQWLVIQSTNRNEYSHRVVIGDLITEVNKFRQDWNDILMTMDGDDNFRLAKKETAKLCWMCKLSDPFYHRHGASNNERSYIRGSHMNDFILCTFDILDQVL